MARKPKPPRERAARALCSYLDMADAALQAALSPEEWEKVKAEGR